MTIPNLISIARLFLVPFTVWLIVSGDPLAAFWVFILAGVSDGVDGMLARHFNMRSALGAYLDPIADKTLLVSIYITLAIINEIPLWVAIVIVSRDVLIVGGVLLAWMVGQPIAMRPNMISKANTVAQIVLAALVLADLAFSPDLGTIRQVMVYVVGALTIGSAVVYLVDWIRHMGTGAIIDTPGSGESRSG